MSLDVQSLGPSAIEDPVVARDLPQSNITGTFKKNGWKGILLFSLLLVSIAFVKVRLLGPRVDTYAVEVGDLHQAIVASGRVISPRRIAIASEIMGRVAAIPVAEGQQVKLGQVLIQLENNEEIAALDQARTSVAQARAKLRQLREIELPLSERNFKEAQLAADQAGKQLLRIRQLNMQNFASQYELDTAIHNYDVAQSRLEAARLKIVTNQPGGSDFALAEATLAQARANLELAKVKLTQDTILAPAAGVLIQRDVEQGDVAQPGKSLMMLAAHGDTQIEAQIDEKNLAKLSIGQAAIGSADAFPDQQFTAEVIYINPGVDATRGSVEVKLGVSQPPPYLRQDMTVSINIEIAKRTNTLIAPAVTVHDSSSKPWVLVVRDNKAVHQNVDLGLLGDERVEIVKGVKAGELVIPVTLKLIKAGDVVRAHRIEFR